MKKFINFANRLPLAGKLMVRPATMWYFNSVTIPQMLSRYALLLIIIGVFTWGHCGQIGAAYNVLVKSSQPLIVSYVLIYLMLNVLAIFIELHLLYRASAYLTKARPSRRVRRIPDMSPISMITAAMFTMLGQHIMAIIVNANPH